MFLGASRSASEADSARLARSCWSGTRRKGIPRVPPLPDFLGGSLLQRFFLGDDDDSAETTQPEKTRGGGDTAAAAAAASRAAAAHLATQWVRFLFLQPLLIRHALRKTKDVVLAERRVFSGSPPGAGEAALCAGLGRTSYPRRHRRPLLRPLRLAVRPRGPACIACPETSWRHYSRPKETSAKIDRRPPCPLMRETPLIGLEKKQLSA